MVNNPTTNVEDQEIREQYQLGLDLMELERSDAFKRVIGGYMTKELVRASEDMITQGPSRQESLEKVMSIGYLKVYLQGIKNDAVSAQEELGA